MAIRDWGGGGDLSGLFGSLIDNFFSDVESSKNRAIRQAEEDAAAEDAELYDKWVNGLINDEEWLAHISRRLDENKNDPEKLQMWTETFRKHNDAIRDGKIESAYQHGEITIHQLITHYQGRMKAVERSSPEYRELSDRYFNIVDQRDADHIDEQAGIIVDKIERGQASYRDLLNFYEKMNNSVRSSSPLKAQIRRQMMNIRQIVQGVGGSTGGGGGGGGGGSRGGRSTVGGGGGDLPSVMKRADEMVTELWHSGNVFVPSGESVVPSVFDMFDVENNKAGIEEAMVADSRALENMMEAWKDNPNDTVLRTPWGQQIANTPENRQAVYNQARANYDYRIAYHTAMGEPDKALAVEGYRNNFVDDYMKYDNSIPAKKMWDVENEIFNQSMNLAGVQTDPLAAMRMYQRAGSRFTTNAKRFLRENANALPEFQVEAELIEDVNFSLEFSQLITNARNMGVEEILTEASLLKERIPEGHAFTEEQFDFLIGDIEGPTGRGLVGKAAAMEGYQATVDLRAGREALVEPWVYVAKPGQSVPTLVKKSMVAEFLGLEDSDWESKVRSFAERVDRTTDPVIVYRQLEAVKPIKWYINQQGRYMSWQQAEQLGRNPEAIRQAGYEDSEIEELAGWRQVTDGTGQTWFVSPTDGLLYRKMPFRAGISGSFDISDAIDGNGQLRLEWVQGAQGLAMGVGGGVTLKQAQQLLMDGYGSGEINLDEMYRTDISTGATTWDNLTMDDLDSMLWSPADAANRSIRDVYLRHPEWTAEKRERRALQARQEQRRLARVREWFDNREATRRPEGLRQEMELNDPILRASQQAGVTLGRPAPRREPEGPPLPTPRIKVPPRPNVRQQPVMIDALRLPQQATPSTTATRPVMPAPRPRYAQPPPSVRETSRTTRPRVL